MTKKNGEPPPPPQQELHRRYLNVLPKPIIDSNLQLNDFPNHQSVSSFSQISCAPPQPRKKEGAGGFHLEPFKRRPQLVVVLTYVSIFMLGVAVGFAPFIKVYIDTCQDDRRIVNNLSDYFNKMSKVLNEMTQLVTHLNQSKSENILAQYPQFANMYIKTAYGIGNKNISLSCPVRINILFIEYKGTKADRSTIDEFNSYCEKSAPKNGSSSASCVVSIQLVYGGFSYLDKSAFTFIRYRCDA